MKKYFLFIAIGIGILLIAGAVYILIWNKEKEGQPSENTLALSVAATDAIKNMGVDTDNDGLADWEERLWNTDPNLFDTDGDGTGDGAEITAGRDPTRPGPNDFFNTSTETTNTIGTENPFEKDSFAYSFAEGYASMIKGGTLNEQEKTELAQRLLLDIQENTVLLTQKTASLGDLSITTEETPAEYNRYAEGFNEQYIATTPPNPENEGIIFQRAVQTQNIADFLKLKTIAESHTNFANALKSLKTPLGIANEHLALINALYNLSIAVEGMYTSQNDPISGIAALQRYLPAVEQTQQSITSLAEKLQPFGITIQ